ncbi:hypothetical protein HDU99_000441 [Rhizoclosmatium hyalinum]|nr:hypothetical protein HDU99_000441 [Rhizoclosmatium hyalinum]
MPFKQVIITLLSPNPAENTTPGQTALTASITKLDKVAHRVDILLMLDVPFTQRKDRLAEYHREAWSVWMRLDRERSSGGLIKKKQKEAKELDRDSLFEEVDLEESEIEDDEGDETSDSVPVAGGVALRVSGYTGSLKDCESVYDHLQGVLLVEFA